jgi:hypothetical protein
MPGASVGDKRTRTLIFLSRSQSSGTDVQPPQSPSISPRSTASRLSALPE